jgi:hypothetical protein
LIKGRHRDVPEGDLFPLHPPVVAHCGIIVAIPGMPVYGDHEAERGDEVEGLHVAHRGVAVHERSQQPKKRIGSESEKKKR